MGSAGVLSRHNLRIGPIAGCSSPPRILLQRYTVTLSIEARLLAALIALSAWLGISYALLLRDSSAMVANLLLHMATPVLVPVFWFAFPPKGTLTDRDPLRWILYPLGYFLYALARGWIEQRFAYPFMDVSRLGWLQTGIMRW